LSEIVGRLAAPAWLAFNPDWPEIVRAWISRTQGGRRVGDVFTLRADVSAIVARCSVDDRAVFFTARPLPFPDAELCDVLQVHAPGAFPRTLAVNPERGWWVTADAGRGDALQYVHRGQDRTERLTTIMRAMAATQFSTIESDAVRKLSFHVSRASLPAQAERLWNASDAEHMPEAWVHSDPAPDNVRVDDDGAPVFIDLEDSWYGPALLMGALALHSMSRRGGWSSEECLSLCVQAWQTYVDSFGLSPARHQFGDWVRLAQLVRLIRRVDRSADGPALLLEEESPRRSRAIASELRRLCH
jgi:hypothetical protein